MDLESESSALESVDDNGMIQQSSVNTADDGRSLDNGSFSDESVKLVSTSTPTSVERETSLEVGKGINFDSFSCGGGAAAYSPVSKGRGLRKWRRIRRDLVRDTSPNMENSKVVLKRGLSGSALSHGNKQMQFQSPDFEQESQGSVGSVNMLKSAGADGFELLRTGFDDSRFMAGIGFSAGVDSEKDDDRSSKSSTATRAPKVIRYEKPKIISSSQRGKSRVENSKKHRGESVEVDKENSHSSLESDSRKPSVRMMNYNVKNGDEADMNGETSKRNENVGGDGEESSINNNNGCFPEELDPLQEAIDGFLTLQEALEKEVQLYREIGKEPMPQHHEGASDVSSPRSEIVTLVNNVEQLEIKLEETRSMLEVKESHIRELESTTNQNKRPWGGKVNIFRGTETAFEDIFRQKIEAEIEYLIYSSSIDNINNQRKLVEAQEALAEEQASETLYKVEEVEMKAGNLTNRAQDLQNVCIEPTGTIKKRVRKITSCFLIQLVLLLTVGLVFMSQLVPESSDIVVPT